RPNTEPLAPSGSYTQKVRFSRLAQLTELPVKASNNIQRSMINPPADRQYSGYSPGFLHRPRRCPKPPPVYASRFLRSINDPTPPESAVRPYYPSCGSPG